MPIALMFPFAEAAGITLTGLGIAKATDIIMNYIQANPEKSKQILSTLMPTMGGIGSMLMKEKSEGTSGEEQPTKQKDTRSKKEIVLDAIRRGREGRGNYSSPDAVGPAVSIRGNVIRGLEEAGEISKERKTPEEMEEEKKTKKPFDYKKFYRADGGRIGYQVGGDVMEETSGKNLSDYISGQGQYTSGSKTPEPGVKIKEELSNFIFNLNIPLNEKIKLLGQLSTSNSRVVEDLKGIGYNKNVYKDKFDSKKIGVQYDNDGFTIGGMYDPENKSKDLFINYKKSFKEGGLISMFREKR
jgi:hypothetical protein